MLGLGLSEIQVYPDDPRQTQTLHSLWCCRTCCSSPLFQILLTAIFLSVLADPAVQSGLLVMTAREKLSSDHYKSEAITAMRPLFSTAHVILQFVP